MPLLIMKLFDEVATGWVTSRWAGFVAGLMAVILISVLISRFQEMRGAMIEKHRGLWTITGLKARVMTLDIEKEKVDARQDGSDEQEDLPEKEEEETLNESAEEMETIEEVYEDEGLLIQEENFVPTVERDTVLTTSKPESNPSADPAANTAFEFRKLLWHEPPNLDYASIYELTDAVQQDIKDIGGADLEWRTNRLVLVVERNLLFDYQLWVQHQWRPKYLNKDSKPLSETGRRFYTTSNKLLRSRPGRCRKTRCRMTRDMRKRLRMLRSLLTL